MQTETLELKIYRFSINVFSFVKSLEQLNISIKLAKNILAKSNLLYSKFLDYIDADEKDLKKELEGCVKISLQCFELIKNADFIDEL